MSITDPERWKRIEALYSSALERPKSERDSYLDQACGDDADLRREVASLLAADENADSFLEKPALKWNTARHEKVIEDTGTVNAPTRDEAVPGTAGEAAGRIIGHYKLIRKLGHGGLGTVYLASRADEQFKKRVAIKLIRPGMASDRILRRFLA